jgi:hypothetical protein
MHREKSFGASVMHTTLGRLGKEPRALANLGIGTTRPTKKART